MHAHCIQHVAFEGLAIIENWLITQKFEISCTRLFNNEEFPNVENIDWLIIMGGPMSVNDETEFPWIRKEKAFIKECIDNGKIVIGICLGAQFIASVLGSKIYRNKDKEIGWFPIHKMTNLNPGLFNFFPSNLIVFHWHGETFDLPECAELIASSEVCKNQIFVYNKKVIGFQCHLETTKESLLAIIENCKNEIIPNKYIHNVAQMEEGVDKYADAMHKTLFHILEHIIS